VAFSHVLQIFKYCGFGFDIFEKNSRTSKTSSKIGYIVTEQWVTAQWSYAASDLDFCSHHWFGCALLSFIVGMHGGYFWRIKEAHRA
jgi:hypothetical protein